MSTVSRLRGRLWPIVQTAAAASAAWWLAGLVLPDGRPSFAAIAAVICLGASRGQHGSKAIQLVGGVVLGIGLASLLVTLTGAGPLQIGLLVVLAMCAAILIGGGEVLTSEAAVSAILIVSLGPGAAEGFSANRIIEGVIGGGVALAISSLLFPADPLLPVARAAQAAFAALGGSLERLAAAVDAHDPEAASAALSAARDVSLTEFDAAVALGRETVRVSPRRRLLAPELDRYAKSFAQVDYAIRDARVLARLTLRGLRSGTPVPEPLAEAIRELARSVWSLAATYDNPDEAISARAHALRAGALAADSTLDVMGQVRSTAVDLRRAADLAVDAIEEAGAPTEELLVPA